MESPRYPTGVTVAAARWSARHPWSAIGLWCALVAAAVATMALVPSQQVGEIENLVGESRTAQEMVTEAGLADEDVETVLLTASDGVRRGAFEADAAEAARALSARMEGLDEIASVGEPLWSADRDAMLVPLVLSGSADEVEGDLATVEAARGEVADDHPTVRFEQAGSTSINRDVWERVGSDLLSAEMISLPITFVIMLVAFGALVAAGIPILLALTSIGVALGLYAPLSYLVPDSGSVASVIMMIGMAVGVDYSLLYLKRERAERRRGHGTLDAIELAAASAGRAVVLSGGAVVVAMSGLFLARDVTFTGLAVGAVLVVAVTVLGSLTVLPAVLARLGHRVDSVRVPLLRRLTDRLGTGGLSGRLLAPVLRFPVAAALVAGLALLAISVPALGMKLGPATIDTLPQDLPAVAAIQRIQAEFPTERPTASVVVTGSDEERMRAVLADVADRAEAAGVGIATGVEVADDEGTAVLTLALPAPEGEPANDEAIGTLREDVVPAAVSGTWAVGGNVAESVDFAESQRNTLPLVVGFVLLLTCLMMWWFFRSVGIALLTTVLNVLSVGAAFGVMALVFQSSWGEGLLDHTSSGYLIEWVPLFCFVVLVGLSMDYHVFVLSRIREHLRAGASHLDAVRSGITETASVVTSAAAVMISVFLAYGFLSMLEMQQLGIGLAAAILIDATVVRLVLLPALLLVFRRPLDQMAGRSHVEEVVPVREPVPV